MLPRLLIAAFMLGCLTAAAQYRNDNVLYKTVDPNELCRTIPGKGYLLLDVRSPGEYSDTSSMVSMNIGRFKGAKNINIMELGTRLSEIADYKDKPVFVYCSHSQRSRRASKMLADSGFTQVYNINGGMTAIQAIWDPKLCLNDKLETNNQYDVISPAEICYLISEKGPSIFLLDVRSDSAFRHISTDAKANSMGILRPSTNIPLAELESRLDAVPKDKHIVITDLFGSDAAKAARLLKGKGYKNVSMLIEGMSIWMSTDSKDLDCKNSLYVSPVSYAILGSKEFGRYTQSNSDYVLLDVRSAAEFANNAKDSWRNIGHMKNAINIPPSELNKRMGELDKNKMIVVYGFSGGTDAFAAADALYKQGYKKLIVLANGIFNIRWTAANDKTQIFLKDLVTDVPETNW